LHPPRRGKADAANYEKLVVDAVFGYLGIDDSLIDDLHIVRHAVEKPGRLVMTIREAT
jgi:Holliday junction resolvase RusA-like endonuclease